jgi:plasmid stabilization system protein ParE
MVRVDWAQPALDDLWEIHEFIARDSRRYAQLTIEQIVEAAGRLARFPQLGEVLSEFSHPSMARTPRYPFSSVVFRHFAQQPLGRRRNAGAVQGRNLEHRGLGR